MTTHSNTGTAMVGYNVQVAVDAKHHLIAAQDLSLLHESFRVIIFVGDLPGCAIHLGLKNTRV
jgi:hypothetical protein